MPRERTRNKTRTVAQMGKRDVKKMQSHFNKQLGEESEEERQRAHEQQLLKEHESRMARLEAAVAGFKDDEWKYTPVDQLLGIQQCPT